MLVKDGCYFLRVIFWREMFLCGRGLEYVLEILKGERELATEDTEFAHSARDIGGALGDIAFVGSIDNLKILEILEEQTTDCDIFDRESRN